MDWDRLTEGWKHLSRQWRSPLGNPGDDALETESLREREREAQVRRRRLEIQREIERHIQEIENRRAH